jgi:intraflagellar transport protein 56
MLGKYTEAEQIALKGSLKKTIIFVFIINLKNFYQGPKSPLQTRILFHISHKQNDAEKFTSLHHQLQDNVQDQLCLASMNYMKNEHQQALEIYKRYLLENRYIFVSYFKSKITFYSL